MTPPPAHNTTPRGALVASRTGPIRRVDSGQRGGLEGTQKIQVVEKTTEKDKQPQMCHRHTRFIIANNKIQTEIQIVIIAPDLKGFYFGYILYSIVS